MCPRGGGVKEEGRGVGDFSSIAGRPEETRDTGLSGGEAPELAQGFAQKEEEEEEERSSLVLVRPILVFY